MSVCRNLILDILRSALWGTPVEVPAGIDAKGWEEVHSVLSMHGLSAFAYDAVTSLPDEMKPPREVTMKFISSMIAAEKSHRKMVVLCDNIDEMLKDAGCKALCLKGLSLSEIYPKPFTRRFTDIDLYSPDCGDEIDVLFRSRGIEVDDDFYRHSHCLLKGVMVENHKCLLDVRGRRKLQEFDSDLKEKAVERLVGMESGGLYMPSAEFSAVFNLHHALSHFIYEGITFKFLTDWIMFLRAESEAMASDLVREGIERHGLMKFAGVMTSFSMHYLGLPMNLVPEYLQSAAMKVSPDVEKKFADDLFRQYEPSHYKSKIKTRLNNVRRIMMASWKPAEFLGQSSISFVMDKFIPILLGRKYEAD